MAGGSLFRLSEVRRVQRPACGHRWIPAASSSRTGFSGVGSAFLPRNILGPFLRILPFSLVLKRSQRENHH